MKRLITALILLPIVALTITKGSAFHFAMLLGFCTFVGMREFYSMALPDRKAESLLAAICGTALIFTPLANNNTLTFCLIMLSFLGFALLFLFRIRDISTAARDIAYAALAFIYIPAMIMHLLLLRQTPYGVQWLIVIMLIVMTNDSTAYYVGSAFGKRPFYPLVSPKKSIEGSIGGLFGSIGGTLIAKFTFFPQLTITDALITAVCIGFIGQFGDLFESMLKRSFGVKDSGTIFPGHGGVLDRMDSIIFAAPVTYYYAIYIFKG